MRFFRNLFGKSKVVCPRCQGKGHVDEDDIIRLNKEIEWIPGSCAYCDGNGKVEPSMMQKVEVGATYLTVDLPKKERELFIKQDPAALTRAKIRKQSLDELINIIMYLFDEKRMNPNEIVEELYDPTIDEESKESFYNFILLVIDRFVD